VYAERQSSTTCRFETGATYDESRDVDRTVQASGHTTRMLEARGFKIPPGNAPASRILPDSATAYRVGSSNGGLRMCEMQLASPLYGHAQGLPESVAEARGEVRPGGLRRSILRSGRSPLPGDIPPPAPSGRVGDVVRPISDRAYQELALHGVLLWPNT
jgi:hypothetical protein